MVYVSNERSGELSVIEPRSGTVERTIKVGKRPRGVHVGAVSHRIYVALSGSPRVGPGVDPARAHETADTSADGLAIIDPESVQVLRRLRVGSDPEQFALDPAENYVVVANENAAEASAWSLENGQRRATFPVSEEPEGVAVEPRSGEIYVSCEALGELHIFSGVGGREVARLNIGGRPRSVAFSADGTRAFVPAEGGNGITIVDTVRHRIERTIAVPGEEALPMGAIVTPDNRTLFVSTGRGNTIVAIDLSRMVVKATIPVGRRPWGIALSPDGSQLYSANGGSNNVSVIDVATLAERQRIPVGDGPWGVATGARDVALVSTQSPRRN